MEIYHHYYIIYLYFQMVVPLSEVDLNYAKKARYHSYLIFAKNTANQMK
jgi:hypothetical protein